MKITDATSALSGLTLSTHRRTPATRAEQAPVELTGRPAPIDEGKLAEQVEAINGAVRSADEHLRFSVHKETHQVIVRLVDTTTDQVLREFPSEKFLDLVVNLQKLAGLQVDETR